MMRGSRVTTRVVEADSPTEPMHSASSFNPAINKYLEIGAALGHDCWQPVAVLTARWRA